MAYSSWSVVFGEVPSAAKWNILGANDASFNDGTGIGAVLTAANDATDLNAGWRTANQTWTYASATTITVPTDATTKYAIGDRIRLVQTTTKYFVITAVAATTLTITGGTDYTLANAAITSPFYSHEVSPAGWPGWFNYTPTFVGFSVDPSGVSSPRFSVNGRIVTVSLASFGTDGTSNTNGKTYTLPITAVGSVAVRTAITTVKDNGTNAYGRHTFGNSGSVTVYPSVSVGTWTTSGACNLWPDGLVFIYEI